MEEYSDRRELATGEERGPLEERVSERRRLLQASGHSEQSVGNNSSDDAPIVCQAGCWYMASGILGHASLSIDHCTRSAMNRAKGSMFISTLPASSAAK